MKPNFRDQLQINSLKLTDEELAQIYDIYSLSNQDREELRETVFELSKLMYLINESTNEKYNIKKESPHQ